MYIIQLPLLFGGTINLVGPSRSTGLGGKEQAPASHYSGNHASDDGTCIVCLVSNNSLKYLAKVPLKFMLPTILNLVCIIIQLAF